MQKRFENKIFFFSYVASFLFIIIFNSCKKDIYQHPILHTGEVTNITDKGAMFYGRVLQSGSEEVVDHGFLWGSQRDLALYNSAKISLGILNTKDFKTFLDNSLEKGKTYYVRSYAVDKKSIYLGRVVSFTSMGSIAPEIYSLEPTSGIWGDTITIYGNRLGATPEIVSVLIDEIKAPLIEHSEDSLKVIIPNQLLNSKSLVTVIVSKNPSLSEHYFSIKKPEIHSLSQEYSSRGDTIIINGYGFHPYDNHNKVYLGGNEVKLIQSDPNTITITQNEYINHGNYTLKVKVVEQQSAFQNQFKVYEPWRRLNDVPWHEPYNNIGFSVDNRAFVAGIHSGVGEYRKFYEYLPEHDTWVQKTDLPFSPPLKSFATDNYGYLMGSSSLCQFNPNSSQWVIKSSMPINATWVRYYSTFSIENSGYVCGGISNTYEHFNELRKYNENTDTWIFKQEFPKAGIGHAVGFSINGKGYVGLGLSSNTIINLDIYEYCPDLNQWFFKLSVEDVLYESMYGRSKAQAFVIDDKAYIFSGSRALGYYSRNNDIYEFDPIKNTFRRLLDCPTPKRLYSFSFAVSGKGYIGGGFVDSPYGNDFWEFDPEKLPPFEK